MNNQQPANILVVDDVPENLHLLIQLLQAQGYKVYAAPNGARALASVRENPPDLMLLDVRMPEMDGYEVCKRIKADECTGDIPILFISGLHDLEDKVKGFAAGGVDYITKPFQAEEVLARVTTHLALRTLQQHMQHELGWHRQAEEDLRVLNQQLHAANASKDKFFSILAHDLRAPFTSLLGLPQAILENIETYSKNDIKKMVSLMYTSSERLYALLTNLLEWSRLERGLIECEPDALVLLEIVDRNLRLFASTASQKQITLHHRIQQGLIAYADENMVNTVLRNLLSNALKFTSAGGSIEVTASRNADMVEVAVSDTGVGIRAEEMESLFRLDIKFSTPGTAGENGTGLGFMLCKELVEKNGGTIRVESEPGKGTTVAFTLPAKSV